ncbi:MAG: DNA adenine methylase, partial [Thermotaleaceae bacterium]
NFTNYDKGGFSRKEQERLKKLCDSLDKKGVQFLLSNAATDFIMELYKDYPIEIVRAKRLVNSQGQNRRGAEEVLVRNYE